MKLVVAVVQDRDAQAALAELNRHGFGATKLASTGGFLRQGNSTLLVGVSADRVDEVLAILQRTSRVRHQLITPDATGAGVEPGAVPVEVAVGGATVFVLTIDRYEKY
ncbi:MAG: cyclic-di-AMP receptor [Firmicutes bacterium]|nr:cyclic-di-AMP receptor [Alicyclobacillaceae bacterium]MCL6497237.1 cyclic-di-AMP receptor [Bacillota bacterium]